MVGFIAKVGWDILKDSMKTLLDASVDPITLNRIQNVIRSFPQVKEIKTIHARNSGRFVFVRTELIFGIRKFVKAHQLSEEIEKSILKEIPQVDQVTIHYEPMKKDFINYVAPVEEDKRTISDHFGDAPYFYLFRMNSEKHLIKEEKILPNPHLKEEKGKGIKVSEWLLQNDVDVVFNRKSFNGRGPSYVFSNADVEVIIIEDKTIEDIRKKLTETLINKSNQGEKSTIQD